MSARVDPDKVRAAVVAAQAKRKREAIARMANVAAASTRAK